MGHRTRWTAMAVLGMGSLGALIGHNACVPESAHETPTWPTRDVLGLSPAWVSGLDAVDRSELHARLGELLGRQSDDGAWVSAPAPVGEAAGSAGTSLIALDDALEQADAEPLLVQWVTTEGAEVVGRSCHLEEGDVAAGLAPDGESGPVWVFDGAFDDTLVGQETEREALGRRLPRLWRWWSRCADDAGQAPMGRPLIEVVRADGAPTLMTYWPERGVIYLNPLWLALWDADVADGGQALRTAQMGLTINEIDACTAELSRTCEVCNTPEKVQQASINGAGTCSRVLFATGEIWQHCSKLDFEIPSGFLRWCINDVVARYNVQVDFRSCLSAKTDTNGRDLYSACDPTFSGSPEELAGHYSGFVASATAAVCLDELVACVPDPSSMQPTDPGNGGQGGDCDEACSEGGGDSDCNGENAYGCDAICDEDAT